MHGRHGSSPAGAIRPGRIPGAALSALLVLFGPACGSGKPGRAGDAAENTATGGIPTAAPPAPSGAPGAQAEGAGGTTAEGAAPSVAPGTGPAPAPGEPNRREVALFFQRADDDNLGPEPRKILLTDSIVDQAKQIMTELIGGPREDGLLPTIPKRTTVLGLYLDRSGTAYVDLSEEFVALHPGGSAEELATIFSIVDSLTYNLPEIKRVRFLVAGEERDTLKSHLDLRRAYRKDMSIVRMEDGA